MPLIEEEAAPCLEEQRGSTRNGKVRLHKELKVFIRSHCKVSEAVFPVTIHPIPHCKMAFSDAIHFSLLEL